MGRELLEELFREYYRRNASRVRAPSRLEAREFGFILFNRQGMVRHLSFGSEAELREYLRRQAPAHAYYSSAYYERPSAPTMDEKGWLGADLVFDIDVDHIETECKELHDSWRCLDCGLTGRGMCPAKCPRCGGERFEREVWVCDLCVEAAKEEALKVCDVLLDEFGLSEDEIKLAFSGHRGFHIHVESEVVMRLEQDARREIVDYLAGLGLDYATLGYSKGRRLVLDVDLREGGWRGRVARSLYDLVLSCSEEELVRIGLSRREAAYVVSKRSEILASAERMPSSWMPLLGLSGRGLRALLRRAIELASCRVDERVTIDTRRLIRLPETLHGKTGFRAVELSYGELESFTIRDAFAFSPSKVALVRAGRLPRRVADYEFSERSGEVEVPLPIALYLVGNSSEVEVVRLS